MNERRNQNAKHRQHGFTLIELLIVIAIIAVLAAILFPVFSRAREKGRQAACTSNMRQIAFAFIQYEQDFDETMPDRRDVKSALPGGYPSGGTPTWSPAWPTSDPRCAWAEIVYGPYIKSTAVWTCPSIPGTPLETAPEVTQATSAAAGAPVTDYWMWRFDRPDSPVNVEDFWGKTESKAIGDLDSANDPIVGIPTSPADVELLVDPYFPSTIATVSAALKGRAVHFAGRDRLYLDGHVKWMRDARLN